MKRIFRFFDSCLHSCLLWFIVFVLFVIVANNPDKIDWMIDVYKNSKKYELNFFKELWLGHDNEYYSHTYWWPKHWQEFLDSIGMTQDEWDEYIRRNDSLEEERKKHQRYNISSSSGIYNDDDEDYYDDDDDTWSRSENDRDEYYEYDYHEY